MKNLTVKTDSSTYDIYIDKDFCRLNKAFVESNLTNRKVCIITDSNVSNLYLNEVHKIVQSFSLEVSSYTFEAGEANKNLDNVRDIYSFLLDKNLDRQSVLVALGGGVTGDICGFVAATYMRGISFVQIPTTLLSQVDSSVGGKVGVDFLENKNMVGAFYQPKFVYANISTLNTLIQKEFASGMGEVIKYGLIMDKEFLNYIVSNKEKIKNLDYNSLEYIIYTSCKLKSEIVQEDEKETGKRELLNFGHTFGHSIETLSKFTITHGNCVAIGSICSLYFSYLKEYISLSFIREMIDLFNYFDLNIFISGFNGEEILKKMYSDKKTKNNILSIVIIKEVGNAISIKTTEEKLLLDCINYIIKEV